MQAEQTMSDRNDVRQKYFMRYLNETKEIVDKIDVQKLIHMSGVLERIRDQGGRVFIIGVGGSAGNASHMVNDFRKIASIEAYAPTDNVSELTARTNDDGFDTIFANWLLGSNLNEKDAIFVLSVGGGNLEKNVSVNITKAIQLAKEKKAAVLGIVGKEDGYTAREADVCVVVPNVNKDAVTAHSEAWQAEIWHMLVFSPYLQKAAGKWEGIQNRK